MGLIANHICADWLFYSFVLVVDFLLVANTDQKQIGNIRYEVIEWHLSLKC